MPLLADAVAAPEYRVHRRTEEGAHAIMIGRVLDAIARPGAVPRYTPRGTTPALTRRERAYEL
jgi:flavin reductase (DIM6/NTAB) family NADH-FMN oxidoreductase RutF